MGINITAIAYGLGAVLAVGGILLLLAGYNIQPQNMGEVSTGETLIGIAVAMWIVGVILRRV
jgi:hypothetical protein